MYPFARMLKEMVVHRRAGPLVPGAEHVSHHRCWPWDIDPWLELNNGRTLTLYDLGRIPFVWRLGLVGAMRAHGWGMTVAGSSVRYRRRVRTFDRFTMRTRALGWDARFIYIEQGIFRGGDCASHLLVRMAFTGRGGGGIVPPAEVLAAAGHEAASPDLPGWVRAWIEAEATRPWPPFAPAPTPRPEAPVSP